MPDDIISFFIEQSLLLDSDDIYDPIYDDAEPLKKYIYHPEMQEEAEIYYQFLKDWDKYFILICENK